MHVEIRALGADQHAAFVMPLLTAFGLAFVPERAEQMKRVPELDLRLAAYDGASIVGSAGAYNLTMTTPGGAVPVSGLTMVGVLPTHRRRGILRQMMRRHLDEARARGQPVAALFASESNIYGRFGYGMASQACFVSIERDRSAFAPDVRDTGPTPVARLVGEEEALAIVPAIWERARLEIPGMPARSDMWWHVRVLHDWEPQSPKGPLQRVVLEIDGRPEAYALYRGALRMTLNIVPEGSVLIKEALGATPRATRLLWRYLLDIDLVQRIEATLLPVDHPLDLLVAEPRRLHAGVIDGLHVRLVDAARALSARRYGSRDRIAIEIDDPFCPWNSGRYVLDGGAGRAGRSERTDAPPDLALGAAALGAAYFGGISFRRLADAGRLEERTPGAVERADALFRSARAPWCPEQF